MTLKLIKPVVVEQGQRFTLRAGAKTVGTGVFTSMNKNLTEEQRTDLMIGKKKRAKKEALLIAKESK